MTPYHLRSQIRIALGALVLMAGLSVAGAVVTSVACHQGRAESARYAGAARKAVELGQLAREQYIHEAHTLLVRDETHVEHHDAWVGKFQAAIQAFRPLVPAADLARLDRVAADSHEVAEVFAHEIVPAVLRSDQVAVRLAHSKAEQAVERMTGTADEVARIFEQRAHDAEDQAERQSWLITGLVGVTSVIAAIFGLLVARKLWSAFVGPIDELERVAHQVASGDRDARMGTPRVVELVSLAQAFDGMLDTLASKEEELRAADKLAALGRVAAGVAHEMNNPLGVIRGYVKTLRRKQRDPDLVDVLGTIDNEASICQRIVEDLLTYARVPALTRGEVDAADLAREVALRCEDEARPQRIVAGVERVVLVADPVRLRQVLVNLLRNAMEASPEGAIELVGQRSGEDGYEFLVRDRGPGLSQEARLHLFEPFFTTRAQGTGLGLAVSYGLIVAHGGALEARERPGGGTEMVVSLPGVRRPPETRP